MEKAFAYSCHQCLDIDGFGEFYVYRMNILYHVYSKYLDTIKMIGATVPIETK